MRRARNASVYTVRGRHGGRDGRLQPGDDKYIWCIKPKRSHGCFKIVSGPIKSEWRTCCRPDMIGMVLPATKQVFSHICETCVNALTGLNWFEEIILASHAWQAFQHVISI